MVLILVGLKFDDEVYKDWKRRTQSLSYTFINEIGSYTERFEELFEWDNTHPLLLREYLKEFLWKQ